jgi:hypothetical protein
MYVVVQLRPSTKEECLRSTSGQIPADLQEALSRLGTKLLPMHSGVNDAGVSNYFYAETPDQPTAERVIAQLQKHNSVEAAFLKPPEGPP